MPVFLYVVFGDLHLATLKAFAFSLSAQRLNTLTIVKGVQGHICM